MFNQNITNEIIIMKGKTVEYFESQVYYVQGIKIGIG